MKYFLSILLCSIWSACFAADMATANFSFTIPEYLSITPLSSPVITANVVNGRTQFLKAVKYRVISNIPESTLYLTTKSIVEGSYEYSLFSHGSQQFVALTNSQTSYKDLQEAKLTLKAPHVLILPVTSLSGATSTFKKDKFEVYIKS